MVGEDACPAIGNKAAVLLESLVHNYALADGKKRIDWLATLLFCGLNGLTLDTADGDAYNLVIAIARGSTT